MHTAGSYDLQGIRVNSAMVSGTIEVVLQYITNPSTKGCLLILSQGQFTGYFAVQKPGGTETQTVLLEGLPHGQYTVSGYDVGRNGLSYNPVAMAAVTLQNVTLEQGTAFGKQGKKKENCYSHTKYTWEWETEQCHKGSI